MLYLVTLSSAEERHLAMICGDVLVDVVKRTGGNKLFLEHSEKLDELRKCILLSAMGPLVAIDKYWPADEAKRIRFYDIVYAVWCLYGLNGTLGADGADRIVRLHLPSCLWQILTSKYLVH